MIPHVFYQRKLIQYLTCIMRVIMILDSIPCLSCPSVSRRITHSVLVWPIRMSLRILSLTDAIIVWFINELVSIRHVDRTKSLLIIYLITLSLLFKMIRFNECGWMRPPVDPFIALVLLLSHLLCHVLDGLRGGWLIHSIWVTDSIELQYLL
jgi:hypothetical protein